jgi:uncharacterized DUF497 family protein
MGVHLNMKIEFDPAKDSTNIARHGLSLQAAEGLDWDTAFEREDDRFDYGETRFVALGLIGDRLYVLVFTEGRHENAVRAISLRPAEKHEVRFYYDQI